MEKYRKFADPGTGINVFLPRHLTQPRRESRLSVCLRVGLYYPLSVIRILLVLAAFLLIAISDLLNYVPILSFVLVRSALRPLLCWVALLLMGVVLPFGLSVEDFRRLKMRRPSEAAEGAGVVLTDFHGFIDILVHAVVTRPTCFVFRRLAGGHLVAWSVMGALRLWGEFGSKCLGSVSPVPEGALIFVWSVPTNGLGVLRLSMDWLSQVVSGRRCQMHVINYSSRNFGVEHLVGSPVSHAMNLMTHNWYSSAQVMRLPEPITDLSLARSYFSRMHPGCLETDLEEADYLKFYSYWVETQSYKKKSK